MNSLLMNLVLIFSIISLLRILNNVIDMTLDFSSFGKFSKSRLTLF